MVIQRDAAVQCEHDVWNSGIPIRRQFLHVFSAQWRGDDNPEFMQPRLLRWPLVNVIQSESLTIQQRGQQFVLFLNVVEPGSVGCGLKSLHFGRTGYDLIRESVSRAKDFSESGDRLSAVDVIIRLCLPTWSDHTGDTGIHCP